MKDVNEDIIRQCLALDRLVAFPSSVETSGLVH